MLKLAKSKRKSRLTVLLYWLIKYHFDSNSEEDIQLKANARKYLLEYKN